MPQPPLSAGVSRQVISPPKGIFLIGYSDRAKGNTGIHDDRHGGLLDDDADLVAGGEASVRANGRTERHDGGGAGFLKALG